MSGEEGGKLAIEVKGLSKSFGRAYALRDLDLEVQWGEVLTLLGPNGSGKTTLIKVLATLTRPDAGSVRVAGLDLSKSGRSVRRNIGVVTHDPLLYPDLTGRENLRLFARLFRLDGADERIDAAAGQMALSSRLDQRVGTLSHGMRKRVGIARALLHEPLILLMDEPESGLDQEALGLLEGVIADRSTPFRTVVVTTHNLERGMAMGNRLVILAQGKVAYQESTESAEASSVRDAYIRHTGMAP
ncbi:MAG: ABC transporter ATP-binding protein [Chloroflexi bacterium]|nr:ABC transporter ATP-binding protein [Chloroflexota bacterium]